MWSIISLGLNQNSYNYNPTQGTSNPTYALKLTHGSQTDFFGPPVYSPGKGGACVHERVPAGLVTSRSFIKLVLRLKFGFMKLKIHTY